MMRRLVTMVATCLMLFGVAACNSSQSGEAGADHGNHSPSAAGSAAGFPTTVESVNGPITIDQQPEKVVLLNDQLV